MRYELWLGGRYLFAKRRERFISVIAVLSIGGVALGVAALLLVTGAMSGFRHEITEKLVGINAHLTVDAPQGIQETAELLRRISATEHVVGVTPFVSGQAILRLPDRAFGVVVRGIDLEREVRVNRLADYMVMGRLPSKDDEAVIGTELAVLLRATPGIRLRVISPSDGTPYEFVISGIFHSGMYEYDANLMAMTLARAQQVYQLGRTVTGIGVKVDEIERASDVKRVLQRQLGPAYQVRTWMELNEALFDALKLEKLTMFVILTLIILVAALNIVSTLIMIVIERTRDIGILKSIGATNQSIQALFIWEGLLIGILGTLLGAGVAWAAMWAQESFHLVRLPSVVYDLEYLPIRVEWADWWKTIAAALAITLVSTMYPARQAARLHPVDALRYE